MEPDQPRFAMASSDNGGIACPAKLIRRSDHIMIKKAHGIIEKQAQLLNNFNTLSFSINLHAQVAVVTKAKLDAVSVKGDCKCD